MKNSYKKISFLQLASLISILVGMILGIVGALQVTDNTTKYALIIVVIIVSVISAISGIIAYISALKGNAKSAIIANSRNSFVQILGPIVAFVLGIMGLAQKAELSGKASDGLFVFLIVTFVIAIFATSLIIKSLKAFRKDKESYSYTAIVSFIAAGALLLFGIAAIVCSSSLRSNNYNPILLILFSLFFVLSDLFAFVGLGCLCIVAEKNAPKTTVADADAQVLNKMAEGIEQLNSKSAAQAQPVKEDAVSEIRRYKQLLDEGIITKEEFEQKKKDLLK